MTLRSEARKGLTAKQRLAISRQLLLIASEQSLISGLTLRMTNAMLKYLANKAAKDLTPSSVMANQDIKTES